MKVLHIINSLNQGGAESILYHLVSGSRNDTEHVVVSMLGEGIYGPKMRALEIPVYALNMPRGRIDVKGTLRLYRLLRQIRPDVVQTWMYNSNFLGGILARLAGLKRVFWGIHHFTLDADKTSRGTRLVNRFCSVLSNVIPSSIVCCSVNAASVHLEFGYCKSKFSIIPNGYDLTSFLPDLSARKRLRREWNVCDNAWLLGLVARWNPLKDHGNLLMAISLVADRYPKLRCVLAGSGMNSENQALTTLIDRNGLGEKIILVGPRNDIPAVMNALDLHVLSSAGEAFPNVVNEAMACGTPCVVTDVGDAAFIVGDCGWVVPPGNSNALADAIVTALTTLCQADRELFGLKCRKRIEENFSLEKMVASYELLWRNTPKA